MKPPCSKASTIIIALLALNVHIVSFAQQKTIGLLSNANQATEGYNLIFPHNQEKVFLVNNNGELLHYWEDEKGYVPGNSVYILPNGNLIKCKRLNKKDDPIFAGGAGATVEIQSWDSELLHSFTLNNDTARLHHDVAPLPNGNILMIAWEKFTKEQALQAGRNPETLAREEIWSEMILEWNPAEDKIVWSWHVWDHLIQDEFSDKDNFGSIEENKGKININYDEHDGHPDWLHINSIAYNPVLDQIVLSVPFFNEFWIIDHSTTKQEAKTSFGGNAGRGGELLFRYGNDKTYLGEPNNQVLYFQHDVEWVNPDADFEDEDFGKISIFNNRLPDTTSIGLSINTIDVETGDYIDPSISPNELIVQKYKHPNQSNLAYSPGLSSTQVFENGNVLMLAGRNGYAYELNNEGEVVWEYRIPLKAGKTVPQGTSLEINNNITFRMDRYPRDYPAFIGKELTSKGLFEEIKFEEVVTSLFTENTEINAIKIYPNPVKDKLLIESKYVIKNLELFNAEGKIIQDLIINNSNAFIDTKLLRPGLYIISLDGQKLKFMKK